MKFFITILILSLMTVDLEIAQAQDEISKFRNKYSVTYKFGIPDGKGTKRYTKNTHTIQLERSFALNKLLSISPVLSYSHFSSALLIKENVVHIGGNISIYPKYLANLLKEGTYDAKIDESYFNIGLQKTINKADHTLVFNIDMNIFNFKIGDSSILSPNIGFYQFISSEEGIKDLSFYTVGLNLRFK